MSKLFFFAFVITSFVALTGCTELVDVPKDERHTLYPPKSAELMAALDSAETCENPQTVENGKIARDSRYGCFCGESHPEYNHSSGTHYTELPLADRLQMVEQYYNDKPVDDVDAACRDHDVCWLYNGQQDADCNRELYRRLEEISDTMQDKAPKWTYNSTEARCAAFTDGISQLFVTHLVNSDYDGAGEAVSDTVMKIVLTPAALVTLASDMFKNRVLEREIFPRVGENCRITTGDDGLRPIGFRLND